MPNDKPRLKPVHDSAAGCYRVTAPPGYCFEQGSLHELISWYPSCGSFRRDAYRAALEDARTYRQHLEPCTDPDCDWCNCACTDELCPCDHCKGEDTNA